MWDAVHYEDVKEDVLAFAVNKIVDLHDLNFERLWLSLTRSERRVMQMMSEGRSNMLFRDRSTPTSTTFSVLRKLIQKGYVVKSETYEIEDPFFLCWIHSHC